MIRTKGSLLFALIAGGCAGIAPCAELKPVTAVAWQEYLRSSEAGQQARLSDANTFLWIDDVAGRKEKVRRGDIVVAPVVGDGTQNVQNGLIHHWIGAVFIPNVTLNALLAVIDDYDSYKTVYKPVVVDSQSLRSDATGHEFSMVWVRHALFVHAAMRARYQAREFVVDPHRRYSVVDATCIQQIENYGSPAERLLPPDTGSGFLWRIHSTSRYEQNDGGVYLEVEVIALSRDIPPSVRWVAVPVVNHLSIASLKTTLHQTRQAVQVQEMRASTN